ncbi:hypothetical protein SCHPADRAFT_947938 [Schizopora paradoxa]|uniref:Nephrocystin 3-like N-terminal domain-containing protein n=1 Tax=Schizopora paradoxa TaxID=27342 RepID=A0A0H2QXP3_9AGAM|nr:hypothetical protein SCHPADRAFT_947938 [Schizopora paradoxa]
MSTIVWRNWPSKDDFNALVKSCGKLFIYASTAIGFIGEGRALRTPEESLQIILNIVSDDAPDDMPYKQLDDLYLRILLEAVGNSAKAESKGMVRFRKILGTIVLLRDPLSVRSLSKLIEEEEQQIWNALRHLSSILIVPHEENSETPVRFFHPSLLDFLIDANRCVDERFFVDVSRLGADLFQRCTVTIIKGLVGSMDEELIPVMRYVCMFWGYHLRNVHDENAQVMTRLDEFVRSHLLKWFRFTRVLLNLKSGDPLLQCMKVAKNWASCYNTEISDTLNSMLRSSGVLDSRLADNYESTYDAARSKCGGLVTFTCLTSELIWDLNLGDEETRRATCHPGTRKSVLAEIKEWATFESAGPGIFWLYGSAYTGKSAVAMSIAEWADEKGFLCGGFFFRDVIDFPKSSELGVVISTISHDLASFDMSMRNHVVEALEGNKHLRYSKHAELQFAALIANPLLSLKQDGGMHRRCQAPILLIIDGLDWCEGAAELLTFLFTHLSGPGSSHVRILITSRPTPQIRKTFEAVHKELHKSANLDEISAEVVRQDIATYLHDGLARVREILSLSTPLDWPDQTDFDSLVNSSRNSFFCAKYALKFLGNSKTRNPSQQLQSWLLRHLDDESFEDMYPCWVAELGAPPVGLQAIAICVSQEPLSFSLLSDFFQMDVDNLKTALRLLYPFIIFEADDYPRPNNSPLRHFYMNSRFVNGQYADLCRHCLRIMDEGLHIAFRGTDSLRGSERTGGRDPLHIIGPGLQYACRNWTTILSKASNFSYNRNLSRNLDTFIQKHLLSWLYTMALLQLASHLASELHNAWKWSDRYYRASFFNDIRKLLEEAWHFANDNEQTFAESPLQVYHAVLDLPENSELCRIYKVEAAERLKAFEEANRAGTPKDDIPSQI